MKTAFCIDCSGSMSNEQGLLAAKFVQVHLRDGDRVYAYDGQARELDPKDIFGGWTQNPFRGGTDVTAVVELARENGAERLVNIGDLEMMDGDREKFDLNVHVDLLGSGPDYHHLGLPADLAVPLPDIRKS